MTIRVGVIGAGLAGQSHAFDIVTDGRLQLAGVVSGTGGSAQKLAGLFGTVAYPDVQTMVARGRIDALVVGVPPLAVFDVLEQVAAAGLPCLVEKPVAATRSERERLSALALSGMTAAVPFNRRYQHHVRSAAAKIAAGDIGMVTAVEALWTGPYSVRFGPGAPTYRAGAGARQGVLVDTGSHALDLASLLLGGLRADIGGADLTHLPSGAEISAELAMVHDGRVPVSLSIVDEPGEERWRCTVKGDCGHLVLDRSGYTLTVGERPCEVHPAKESTERPASDLPRLLDPSEGRPLGSSLSEALVVSDVLAAAFRRAGAPPWQDRWLRPRAKALGRLNGSC